MNGKIIYFFPLKKKKINWFNKLNAFSPTDS